jgi:hypothetical protein
VYNTSLFIFSQDYGSLLLLEHLVAGLVARIILPQLLLQVLVRPVLTHTVDLVALLPGGRLLLAPRVDALVEQVRIIWVVGPFFVIHVIHIDKALGYGLELRIVLDLK